MIGSLSAVLTSKQFRFFFPPARAFLNLWGFFIIIHRTQYAD